MIIMFKLAKEFKKQVRISELPLVRFKELEKRESYHAYLDVASEQEL